MGSEIDLWGVHMEGAFLGRMVEIVKVMFEEIGQDVQEPLKVCLELASKAEPCGPGEVLRGGKNESNQELWRKGVEGIVEGIDNKVKSILQGVVLMLGGSSELSSYLDIGYGFTARTASGSLRNTFNLGKEAGRKRVSLLESAVHEACKNVVTDLAEELNLRLKKLPVVTHMAGDACVIEQVLVLGSVANLVQAKTYYIPLAMASASSWTQLEKTSPAQRSNRYSKPSISSDFSKPDDSGLNQIKLSLREIDLQSVGIWSNWVGRGLCKEMQESITKDEILLTNQVPSNWEEIIVSAEDDMKFKLPAISLASSQLLLMKACRELRRAGGSFMMSSEAMKLYAWILMECVINSMSQVLGLDLGGNLSEKGVLQLLLDLRFVKDVLQGGAPPGKTPESEQDMGISRGGLQNKEPEVAAALANRKVQLSKLQEQLTNKLDPIDWATYEPHLWKLEERYCAKVAVLYGSLTQLSPLTKKDTQTSTSRLLHSGTHAGMNISPVCPRFHYLPISTPSVKDKDQGARRSGVSIFELSPEACSIRESDLVSQYSLTNFSDKKSFQGSKSSSVGQQGGALLPQAASFQQLGNMFTDRASEMTAMAQERFQNLQTNIFQSFRTRQ
eukprot:TRINITY_DN10318_c0_g1_i1.p1 TRINITY_DN10318_c0_g1~~TRINITY_DN10318_c0_g1_i1.p1  ORF type:complete len:615 (+),score=88.50 TRINITY_DN10318_c0_g1_i1:304-2148(+)